MSLECFKRGSVFLRLASVFLLLAALTYAQSAPVTNVFSSSDLKVTPTAADHAAVASAKNLTRHALPLNSAKSRSLDKDGFIIPRAALHASHSDNGSNDGSNSPFRAPGDVSYQGGAVVEYAAFHAIYLNPKGLCKISTCWGDPEGYLSNLGTSNFIHITDQYVGLNASDRYTLGHRAILEYFPSPATAPGFSDYQPITDAQVQAVVHAVAALSGQTGYGHIYHVFLPPGQDECFDSTFTTCYSPDNFNAFAFCAYHGSVDFSDIGHVLYTVEPYQNAVGCNVKPGTPNGALIDSTNNVLNHETFETITDPDGTAWWNSTNIGSIGQEVADECTFVVSTGWDVPDVLVGAHLFAVQRIYSNSQHTCSNQPY